MLAGPGFSAQRVFLGSMLPNAVEHDQDVIGERREGVYCGVWACPGELTKAPGIAVSSWIL